MPDLQPVIRLAEEMGRRSGTMSSIARKRAESGGGTLDDTRLIDHVLGSMKNTAYRLSEAVR